MEGLGQRFSRPVIHQSFWILPNLVDYQNHNPKGAVTQYTQCKHESDEEFRISDIIRTFFNPNIYKLPSDKQQNCQSDNHRPGVR